MSKKLYFLISFVLVLVLAGNVLAYDSMIWDNDQGNGDQLWDTAVNWKKAGPAKVPAPADWVELSALGMGDANNGPIINSDMNATCMWVDYGYYKAGNEVILTMTGGTFTSTSWFAMGYYQDGYFSFDLSGGTANFGQVIIGERADSGTYTHNISGGTLNASGIELGIGVTPQADINMTGGDVNVANWLDIGAYGALAWWDEVTLQTGKGHVDLHGGTLEVGYLGMGGGGEGTMDIAGGTLIIDGDYREPTGWLFDPCSDDDPNFEGTYTGTIAILAKRGLITAYGVEVGEIITDDINHPNEADLRAVINPDYDVTNPGQTTITAGAVDPNWAFNPDPLHFNGDLPAADINQLSWNPGTNAVKHDVYFGTVFADVNNATVDVNFGTYMGRQALADVNYPPASLTWNQTCYWRIDELDDSNVPQWGKGRVWHFVTRSASARNPSPTGGSAALYPIFTWTPGPLVQATGGHYLYFSSDFNDVNDRNTDPSVRTILDTNTYSPPAILAFDTQYWWAVDEINDSEDPCTWPSLNWSFTTENHLFVDNMESYASHEDIKDVWMDWSSFDARSDIYIETSAARVRNGDTSMRFNYNNNKVTGTGADDRGWSEGWANASDLWASTNWTITGAKALVLYFRGKATNPKPQPMYLILTDGAGNEGMVTYDDESSVQEEFWHPWYIDLNDSNFTTGATPGPVDMTDVNQIWLGIGVRGLIVTQQTSGGEGDVYFDDIGLYPSMCFPEQVVDITGDDCITNYRDLDIMGRDWLMYDYNVPAVAISGDPCGWWRFDNHPHQTVPDDSGQGNTGTVTHADWVTAGGYPEPSTGEPNGDSMHFDGDQIATYDRVVCAERINEGNQVGDYPAELMPDTFTVACWVKVDSFDYFEGLVSNGTDYTMEEGGFYLYSSGFSGNECFGVFISTEESIKNFVETENIYKIDTWYHLAATYNDANMVNIYVDGELVPSGLARFSSDTWEPKVLEPTDVGGPIKWMNADGKYPASFVIGADWYGDDEQFWWYSKATIDEVRVYGYGMPYGEIVTLAEQGPVLYHDLISPAELYDLEPQTQRKVNFRDYRILADNWLKDAILWPN